MKKVDGMIKTIRHMKKVDNSIGGSESLVKIKRISSEKW
jgi:hypothetical protein